MSTLLATRVHAVDERCLWCAEWEDVTFGVVDWRGTKEHCPRLSPPVPGVIHLHCRRCSAEHRSLHLLPQNEAHATHLEYGRAAARRAGWRCGVARDLCPKHAERWHG